MALCIGREPVFAGHVSLPPQIRLWPGVERPETARGCLANRTHMQQFGRTHMPMSVRHHEQTSMYLSDHC